MKDNNSESEQHINKLNSIIDKQYKFIDKTMEFNKNNFKSFKLVYNSKIGYKFNSKIINLELGYSKDKVNLNKAKELLENIKENIDQDLNKIEIILNNL